MNTYIKAHWDGTLPLWKTYWVNGILARLAAMAIGALVGGMLGATGTFLSEQAWGILSPFLVMPVTVWSLVGVWRAGRTYTLANPQKKFWCWGRLARFLVVVGIIRSVLELAAALLM